MMLAYDFHGVTRRAPAETQCFRCGKSLADHSPILRLCDTTSSLNVKSFCPKNHNHVGVVA